MYVHFTVTMSTTTHVPHTCMFTLESTWQRQRMCLIHACSLYSQHVNDNAFAWYCMFTLQSTCQRQGNACAWYMYFTLQSTCQRQRICLILYVHFTVNMSTTTHLPYTCMFTLQSTLQRQRICLIHVCSLYNQHVNGNAFAWYLYVHFTVTMSTTTHLPDSCMFTLQSTLQRQRICLIHVCSLYNQHVNDKVTHVPDTCMFTLESTCQRQRICLILYVHFTVNMSTTTNLPYTCMITLQSILQRQRIHLIPVCSLYSQHVNDNAFAWYMHVHFAVNIATATHLPDTCMLTLQSNQHVNDKVTHVPPDTCMFTLESTCQRQRICLIHICSLYGQHCNDNAFAWYTYVHFTVNIATTTHLPDTHMFTLLSTLQR